MTERKPKASAKKKNGLSFHSTLVRWILGVTTIATFVNIAFYGNYRMLGGSIEDQFFFQSSVRKGRKVPLLPSKVKGGKGKRTCVVTIAALNNFGFVLALYDSIVENSPGVKCFLWYMGDTSKPTDPVSVRGLREIRKIISAKDHFQLITMDELEEGTTGFNQMEAAFKFDLVEFQTTIKPFALKHVFDVIGAESVIFLDNDIWVTDSLGPIENLLKRYSAVITPHSSSFVPADGHIVSDIDLLAAGVFNFGFVAFSRTQTAYDYLTAWGERLMLYGFVKPEKTMFYDQIWGNLIPSVFDREDHYILRDLRYNIAYWNLHERGKGLHLKDGVPHFEDPDTGRNVPAGFVHFSGTSSLENFVPDKISKHQTRFTLKDFPRIKDVLFAYVKRLSHRDTLRFRNLPYGFDHFTNGAPIEGWMRELYAGLVHPVLWEGKTFIADIKMTLMSQSDANTRLMFQSDSQWKNPFETFPRWLLQSTPSKAVDMDGKFFYNSIQDYLWKSRPDLQAAFPDPTGEQYESYLQWFRFDHVVNNDDDFWLKEWLNEFNFNLENHSTLHHEVHGKKDIGLNIYGWPTGLFSIGLVAKKFLQAARTAEIPFNAIASTLVRDRSFVAEESIGFKFSRKLSQPVTLVAMNADCTSNYFLSDTPSIMMKSQYIIGYWNWELPKFIEQDLLALKVYDEIWVPAGYVEQSLKRSPGYDGTPVRVVPIPHDPMPRLHDTATEILPESLKEVLPAQGKKKPFTFLFVFDFFSFVERKNPYATITAFLKAFPLNEKHNVQLILKSHSGTSEQVNELMDFADSDPRIIIINELLSDEENAALKEYQDCHVSLHRSEGYGLNILESMSIGVPVIATDYSGNTGFFEEMPNWNGVCGFPIGYTMVEIEEDHGPYKKGNHWAEADTEAAALAMKSVMQTNCKEKFGKQYAKETISRFGSEAIGKRMLNYLEEALPRIQAKVNSS